MTRPARRGSPSRRLFTTHRRPDGRSRGPSVEPPRLPRGRSARVDVAWDGVRRLLPDAAVRDTVRRARAYGEREDLALSIVFVTDRALARLHGRHLGDRSTTDVITFDLSDDLEGPTGEIYVSAERAAQVARERRVSVKRELSLYVVHGVLHLCGYDDHAKADRAAMRAAEAEVLRSLGFEDDASPHDG